MRGADGEDERTHRLVGEEQVGSRGADDAAEQLAQPRPGHERPVGEPQEGDHPDPEPVRGGPLLGPPARAQLGGVDLGVLTAERAVRADEVRDVAPRLDQPRDRPAEHELGVVRMRADREHALVGPGQWRQGAVAVVACTGHGEPSPIVHARVTAARSISSSPGVSDSNAGTRICDVSSSARSRASRISAGSRNGPTHPMRSA